MTRPEATATAHRWVARFLHAFRESLPNLVLLAGLGLIVAGCWRISEPLALIVAGVFVLILGVLLTLQEIVSARR